MDVEAMAQLLHQLVNPASWGKLSEQEAWVHETYRTMAEAVLAACDEHWQQRITALEAALTRAEGIARAAERYIQAFDAADEEASIMGGGMTIDERWAMKDLRAALTPISAGAAGEEEDRDV